MSDRGKVLQKRLMLVKSTVCMKALLSAFLITHSASAQERDPAGFGEPGLSPHVVPHRPNTPQLWTRDAEYLANWGLNLAGFDGAYALGAYGQNIKVGVLDDGTWSGHHEFKSRNNLVRFAAPFADTKTAGINASGTLLNHGLHVAGIIGANRDGQGMHGGAFLSTVYAGVGAGAGSMLTAPGATQAVIDSGISFLNNSWGNNFQSTVRYPSPISAARYISKYAVPIAVEVNGEVSISYHGPDVTTSNKVSAHLIPGSRVILENLRDISRAGTVNVFSVGNDIHQTTLFRGIAPSPLTATLPNVLAGGAKILEHNVSTAGEEFQVLRSRFDLANALPFSVADRLSAYRSLIADMGRVAPENLKDPRIVRLNEHVQLLLEPTDGHETGYEKLEHLRSDTAWASTDPKELAHLSTLRTSFIEIASLTDEHVVSYISDAHDYLDSLDVATKLHPSVIRYQTELAALEADRELYKSGKFEPSAQDRAFLESVRTQDDFRLLEKHWLTVANLSNDQRISSNSNICGASKYYCLSAPGGSYSQAPGSGEVATPAVPAGVPVFDQHGNTLQAEVPAREYQIFSLGIT